MLRMSCCVDVPRIIRKVHYNGSDAGDGGATAVQSVLIAEGAHHLDLMFSNPHDPQCVKDARAMELSAIRSWVAAAKKNWP